MECCIAPNQRSIFLSPYENPKATELRSFLLSMQWSYERSAYSATRTTSIMLKAHVANNIRI